MNMKALNQTWKQKRSKKPIQTSVKSTNDERFRPGPSNQQDGKVSTVENDSLFGEPLCMGESLNSFGLSCDWDSAAISAINELDPKEQNVISINKDIKAKNNKPQTPIPHLKEKGPVTPMLSVDGRQDRISTPIDTAERFSPRFNQNFISPVFNSSTSNKSSAQHKTGFKNGKLSGKQTSETVEVSIKTAHVKENAASDHKLSIDAWELPVSICEKYKEAGIKEMFPWQKECIMTGAALNGGNLVYSAPTSAGKTLVAELLMLKRILKTKKKAIYILPFVSVAREKMFHLQKLFKEAGICVDGYMGSQAPSGGFASTDIAVCTIEKANSLINRLMEENKISSLGVIVVDEMHMIGDGHRGYLLELMLSKIRFLQGLEIDNADEEGNNRSVQIIGMSATLPNLEMFSTWLNADLYVTDYRPVPLTELMKVGKVITGSNLKKVFEIDNSDVVKGDEEHIIPLCLETIHEGNSVLIFCPTKSWCEKLAKTISEHFKKINQSMLPKSTDQIMNQEEQSAKNLNFIDQNALSEVIEQLRRSPAGLDSALGPVVTYGVSFHHAGLTFDERDVIESAFRRGAIRVLVATSTLSSGVNLPARRVIIRTPMFHGKVIDSLVYKQMSGRAGRKGVDTKGESILICKPSEKMKGNALLRCHLQPVYSCLLATKGEDDIPGMKRALLEIIAAGVASTPEHIERYATCTFLNACLTANGNPDPTMAIRNAIKFLSENEFIRLQSEKKQKNDDNEIEKYHPTQLGSATLASALSPDEALVVFRELQKARKCFVLENELHIVYQVMPIYMQSQWPDLDWYHYFTLFEKLPLQYKRVGEIVGVEEAFLARAIKGRIPTRTAEQRQKLAVHQRFYSALVLMELINEISLRTVSRRYNVSKGLLQSLQSSASTFAGMVTKFCEKLGWRNLELLLEQFQSRLSFGVSRELCDLVRITSLNGARARLFFNAGYHTISAVAAASVADITKLLVNSAPFESKKGENMDEVISKNRARCIWITGRDGLTEEEAAILIMNEAKEILQSDVAGLGLDLKNVELISKKSEDNKDNKDNKDIIKDEIKPTEIKDNERNDVNTNRKLKSATKMMAKNLKRKSSERTEYHFEKRCLEDELKHDNLESKTKENNSLPTKLKSVSAGIPLETNVKNSFTDIKKSITPSLSPSTARNKQCHVLDARENKSQYLLENERSARVEVNAKRNSDEEREVKDTPSDCINSVELQGVLAEKSEDCYRLQLFTSREHKIGLVEKSKEDNLLLQSEEQAESNEREKKNLISISDDDDTFFIEDNISIKDDNKRSEDLNKCVEGYNNNMKDNDKIIDVKRSMEDRNKAPEEFNKSAAEDKDASVEDGSGSLILFGSSASESFSANEDLNITPELFPGSMENDLLSEEFEMKNWKEDEMKISSTKSNAITHEIIKNAGKMSVGESKVTNKVDCKDQEVDVVIKETDDKTLKLDDYNTANDNHKAQGFCLTLSESIQDNMFGSIELISDNDQSDSIDLNQCLRLDSDRSDLNDDNKKVSFTHVRSKCDLDAGRIDSNLILSESDSFTDLMRDFQTQDYEITKKDYRATNVKATESHNGRIDLEKTVKYDLLGKYSEAIESKTRALSEGRANNRGGINFVEIVDDDDAGNFDRVIDLEKTVKYDNAGKYSKAIESKTTAFCESKARDIGATDFDVTVDYNYRGSREVTKYLQKTVRCDQIKKFNEAKTSETTKFCGNKVSNGIGIDLDEKIVHNHRENNEKTIKNDQTDKYCDNKQSKTTVYDRKKEEKYGRVEGREQTVACYQGNKCDKAEEDKGTVINHEGKTKNAITTEHDQNSKRDQSEKYNYSANNEKIRKSNKVTNSNEIITHKENINNKRSGKIEKRRSSKRIAQMTSSAGSQEDFSIIDVTIDRKLFQTFINEWKTKSSYSFSFAYETNQNNHNHSHDESPGSVVGVAICWGGKDSYYVSFDGNSIQSNGLINDVIDVTIEDIMSAVSEELSSSHTDVNKIVFDLKKHVKVLLKSFGIEPHGNFSDPKVASWLFDPAAKELTLHEMVMRYLSNDYKEIIKKVASNSFDTGSIGLTSHSTSCPRLRSSVEAVVVYKLMSVFESRLQSEELYSSFQNTEMPVMLTLGKMEACGIGFSAEKCRMLENVLKERMTQIEEKCRGLVGHRFSITSPEEIAHALFIELKLPPNGDPESHVAPQRGTKSSRSKVRHLSTAKGILEKLKDLHPLPRLILEWRKVHNALVKNVYPIQRSKSYCANHEMNRIFFNCFFHTVTGRIMVAEPNIQNIPKDFEMELGSGAGCKIPNLVSLRKAFVPFQRGIFIGADYSQLELRIITHLSKDRRLMSILNDNGDVFRMIAAEINQCTIEEVSDDQRQCTKHICYGIIYGIGSKSLGEKLGVSEEEAGRFIETFKNRFKGIKDFVKETVKFVSENGYVLTMNGRRRYIPMINSRNIHTKGQAERQAVNTTVQGSAADLVKKAMIDIDIKISKYFEKSFDKKPRLVLQMHDELIYECCIDDKERVIEIIKTAMEQAVKLGVALPVKVKTGHTWGDFKDYRT